MVTWGFLGSLITILKSESRKTSPLSPAPLGQNGHFIELFNKIAWKCLLGDFEVGDQDPKVIITKHPPAPCAVPYGQSVRLGKYPTKSPEIGYSGVFEDADQDSKVRVLDFVIYFR